MSNDGTTHGAGCWIWGRQHIEAAALLALGILWMDDRRSDKTHAAYTALRDALGGREALRRAIQTAIDAGYEASHPAGADWWAGKRDDGAAQGEGG